MTEPPPVLVVRLRPQTFRLGAAAGVRDTKLPTGQEPLRRVRFEKVVGVVDPCWAQGLAPRLSHRPQPPADLGSRLAKHLCKQSLLAGGLGEHDFFQEPGGQDRTRTNVRTYVRPPGVDTFSVVFPARPVRTYGCHTYVRTGVLSYVCRWQLSQSPLDPPATYAPGSATSMPETKLADGRRATGQAWPAHTCSWSKLCDQESRRE